MELKPRQIEQLATYEKAQQRLLQCLRALDMELEITNLYLHYSKDELVENFYKSQAKWTYVGVGIMLQRFWTKSQFLERILMEYEF